jgi:hypothetical protein
MTTVEDSVDNYQKADCQSSTDRGRPYTGITFTGSLVGSPILEQLYFVQDGPTICAMSILVPQSASTGYDVIIGNLVDSVQAVKP